MQMSKTGGIIVDILVTAWDRWSETTFQTDDI